MQAGVGQPSLVWDPIAVQFSRQAKRIRRQLAREHSPITRGKLREKLFFKLSWLSSFTGISNDVRGIPLGSHPPGMQLHWRPEALRCGA